MERSNERETHRRIREEIQHTIENRTCCPLSFCNSTNHKTIEECDHPNKYVFVGMFHNSICRICFDNAVGTTFNLTEIIDDVKTKYFTEEHITDEQIEILTHRIHISPVLTWGKSRTEKIEFIMKRYEQIIKEYYYGYFDEPDDEMMDQVDVIVFDNPRDELANPKENLEQTETKMIELNYKEVPNTKDGYLTEITDLNTLLECPICYEAECFITTNCNHHFCECILTHIAKTKEDNIAYCPNCREKISVLEICHKKNYKIIAAMSSFQIIAEMSSFHTE